MIKLSLPWPPSVNHYWFQNGNRRFIGKKGVDFRKAVAEAVAEQGKKLSGRLMVAISLFPPDKRRRDIDNPTKAVLDAMQHAGLFDDDEQIDYLSVQRMEIIKGGICKVVVTEL